MGNGRWFRLLPHKLNFSISVFLDLGMKDHIDLEVRNIILKNQPIMSDVPLVLAVSFFPYEND